MTKLSFTDLTAACIIQRPDLLPAVSPPAGSHALPDSQLWAEASSTFSFFCLCSQHLHLPPAGAFYQDLPRVDAVGVTLQYDMDARLNAPTWLDGYQQFKASWRCL